MNKGVQQGVKCIGLQGATFFNCGHFMLQYLSSHKPTSKKTIYLNVKL